MLYIKNNKLYFAYSLFLLIYLHNLIHNKLVFADDLKDQGTSSQYLAELDNKKDDNKYQTLEVKLNIVMKLGYKSNTKELEKLNNDIKKDLLIYKATLESKLTINRIQNLHNRAPEEILTNLQSFGYYEQNIIENNLSNVENNRWVACYKVEIGDPIKIKKIQINLLGEISQNKKSFIQQQINKYLKINANLVHENYEKAKQFILNNLHEDGFLNAQIKESKVLIDLQANSANIIITVAAKQQYYLGKVKFKSEIYSKEFLNKYVPFKEHDLYSMNNLMQLKNNLLNSGLFSKVRIDAVDINDLPDKTVPIIVRVYNKPKHKYFGSLGFGSDTAFRGSLGYVYSLQSLPGNIINMNLSMSKKRKQALFNYSFLGKNPMTQKYNFGLILQKEKIKDRRNKNLELYFQKSINKNNFNQIWKLSLLKENFQELPAAPKRNATLLLPSLKFTWLNIGNVNATDFDKTDPREEDGNDEIPSLVFGNKFTITTKIGLNPTISSANLIQLIINEKLIKPFVYDTRIILKATLGTSVIKDFNKLPLSLRFFTGGDHTIRGFGYNTLGPVSKDSANNIGVIGGKHLFFTSIELEKPIPKYPQLAATLFLDAGNACNNFYKFASHQLAIGTGIGASYSTQIGSLKLYLAKPIKQPKLLDFTYKKKHLRIHLNFTTDL